MKYLLSILFCAFLTSDLLADKWILIFEYQGETKIHWVTEKPTAMNGLTIIGPIPDGDSPKKPPLITNNDETIASVSMLDIDGKPVGNQQEFEVSVDPQSVKPGEVTDETKVYVTYVSGNNQLELVEAGPGTDYSSVLEWLKNNGGCSQNSIGFLYRNEPLVLNGKKVNTRMAKIDSSDKYGDILIDGVPLVFD